MSKTTGRQPVRESIRVSVLMERLVGILDDVCKRLADVQAVVSDQLGAGELDGRQMERLQGLDALTQEVEAVRAVLAEVGQMAPREGDPACPLATILAGVRLSQIRDMLLHGELPDMKENRGDFTMF